MHHHFTVVLAGATAHFITGWVLSCDMFLGKIWKNEKDKKSCLTKNIYIKVGVQALVSIALAIATCIAITVFEKYQITASAQGALDKLASLFLQKNNTSKDVMNALHSVLFIWAGFIIPTSVQEIIWCGEDWKHLGIQMISQLMSLIAIAVTVTYLS